jgi:hypothetical protein
MAFNGTCGNTAKGKKQILSAINSETQGNIADVQIHASVACLFSLIRIRLCKEILAPLRRPSYIQVHLSAWRPSIERHD